MKDLEINNLTKVLSICGQDIIDIIKICIQNNITKDQYEIIFQSFWDMCPFIKYEQKFEK